MAACVAGKSGVWPVSHLILACLSAAAQTESREQIFKEPEGAEDFSRSESSTNKNR
jgi:hypothetical protein